VNPNTFYDSLNERVLAAVPLTGQRILDVGCGAGRLGKQLKARQPCHVTGITHSGEEALKAREWLDDVHEVDLEQSTGLEEDKFDVIVLSHILEHIRFPEALLARILGAAIPGAAVIVALPNVLWWKQRFEFLRGRFRYADSGLMDRTHVHFFDRAEAVRMLRNAGLTVERFEATGGWPGSRFLGPAQNLLDRLAVTLCPGLFGGEFVFVCRYGSAEERAG
jgi:2-polyprenyl-3-methyl-5-hydroxy-6-metoxy-1,4-benzoquinol methylase